MHFPVIVIFLYQPFMGTILKTSRFWQTPALVGMIGTLSVLMYHFVESPFRSDRKIIWHSLAFAIAVLILSPVGMIFNELRFPKKEMMIYQAWTDRAIYRCGKINRLIDPTALSCEINDALEKPTHRILLVGNSHADSIKMTFASVAQSKNISVRFMVENEPLMEGGITPKDLINEAQSRNVDTIVLHYSPQGIKLSSIEQVVALAEDKGINVSFIMPVPVWQEHIPMALMKNMKWHEPLPSTTLLDYHNHNRELIEGLLKINHKNFKTYQIVNNFCKSVCIMADNTGKPLYFDSGHLTLTGSELLRGLFEQVVATSLNRTNLK